MSAERHLALVNPATGEIAEDAPSYPDALSLLTQLETSVRMLERDLQGKRLRIATLESDRERAMLDSPLCPQVECIHACWKVACKKRRPLKFTDRENIEDALRKFDFATCLRAVAGAKFDSRGKDRRNGTPHYWNDLDDIFKTFGWVTEYAARAPVDWSPDPEKVAAIAKVEVAWVREALARSLRGSGAKSKPESTGKIKTTSQVKGTG